MIQKKNIKDLYELSPLQQGILFHYLKDKDSHAYFEQMELTIEGELNCSYLEDSLNGLIQKYDILRTVFIHKNFQQPVQVVLKERTVTLQFEDLSQLHENEINNYIETFKQEDRNKGFDITQDVLIRFSLFKVGQQKYRLIWSHHHILMDGWCLGLILEDLFTFYYQRKNGEKLSIDASLPYSRYIKWLKKQNNEAACEYWNHYLEGYEELCGVPQQNIIKQNANYKGANYKFDLGKVLTAKLSQLAKENQVTLSTAFQVVWGILLQKYNRTNDVVFGTVVSGRPSEIKGIEEMVGLFINTVPVRVNTNKTDCFIDVIREMQQSAIASNKYDYMSLSEIQGNALGHQELLNHVLVFENYPLDLEALDKTATHGFKIVNIEAFEQTNYDFDITIYPGEKLEVVFNFNQEVYAEEFVQRMASHLQMIIEQVTATPNISLQNIEIISDLEKNEILETFNYTEKNYSQQKTVHELFEEQVSKTPENIALVFQETKLTYRELNEKANQLANLLREKGITRNEFVAIMVDRSIEMIVGVLAIIKAGAAYVPIDYSYPIDRIEHMLEDSKSKILLTQSGLRSISGYKGETIEIDTLSLEDYDSDNLDHINDSKDLIYMIYTSGSTGKPKGVMIEHKSVCNLSLMAELYGISAGARTVQVASFSFDTSVSEIFGSLLNGATLYLITKEFLLSGEKFVKWLKQEAITTIEFIPSMLRVLPYEDLPQLQTIRTGGEALTKDLIEKWGKGRTFVNAYGPTETTVDATVAVFQNDTEKIHIGKPICNKKAYIVNEDLQLQPVGIAGELCIGGEGLAQGYWNRQDLTEEKFIDNPFIPGEKMYKTGDLARFLPDGNIEYLGRIDDQVKIRGYRIELGEIELTLSNCDFIKEAIVTTYQNEQNATELCVYFVTHTGYTASDIKRYITARLPDYMVPSYFIEVDYMPLTPSGKVDKKALPAPQNYKGNENQLVLPTNDVEEGLLQIWREVLGRTQLGTTEHFFQIGGHSLKAMMLHSRIHKLFHIEVPLREIFARPTIKELANYIKGMEKNEYKPISLVEKRDVYPVSSSQKRMYAIQQLEGEGTTYNMPLVFELTGELNIERLQTVFQQLVVRHEAFRTSFHLMEGELVQKIVDEVPFTIKYRKAADLEWKSIMQSFLQPFRLESAPLLRVELVQLTHTKYILLIDMHHIISDGMSADILMREMIELYKGNQLTELRIQYKDYAAWEKEIMDTDEMKKQEEYWLNQFEEEIPVLEIPTDYPRPATKTYKGDVFSFTLQEEVGKELNRFIKHNNVSLYMMLLASYNVLLSKYTRQEDIVIGSPIAGRFHLDLEPIIGMFANTLALRNYPIGTERFGGFLEKVKKCVIQASENANYPFEKLVERLNVQRNLSRNPLFDTMFVLENAQKEMEHEFEGVTYKVHNMEWKNSKFDLTWYVKEEEKIEILVEYSTDLFSEDTIARMTNQFSHILSQVMRSPDMLIQDIELATVGEKEQILTVFNNTKHEYPRYKTIHSIFEEQAEKTPNHIAIEFGNDKLTYQEVNKLANQLAHMLRDKGINRNHIVGIFMERSLEMMIGILGVLKAGGAYMPISPAYPEERIQYMVRNSDVDLILTQTHLSQHINHLVEEHICLDEKNGIVGSAENLEHINEGADLAYVLYTSGSTGKPKGVMIEHHTVLNRVQWMVHEYDIHEDDVLLQKTPIVFDVSVWELFMWFFVGARVHVLVPDGEKSPEQIIKAVHEHKVSTIHFVPSMFNVFLEYLEENEGLKRLTTLKRVFTSGEALTADQVSRFRSTMNNVNQTLLYNLYGPTEATVDVSYFNCPMNKELDIVPIGKPIHNVTLYIMDSIGKLQPVGVPGELCIGGKCLARGYMGREDLTKEKFITNPFVPNEKLYKTGDLARWLPDGDIEYLGRIDNQVKIRGYRIELDEVTGQLLKHEKVKDGVVIARNDHSESSYLCAYFTSSGTWNITEMRQHFAQGLPDYMIPSYFVELQSMPLTHNGKLDRGKLPAPETQIRVSETSIAPNSEMEILLAEIWKKVLGLERIGVEDNFFELGGDSIKAIHVVAQLNQHGLKVEMNKVFKHPTISEIIPFIRMSQMKISQDSVEGEVALSPIQHWFFEQKMIDENHWNQAVLLHHPKEWDSNIIQRTFCKIMEHHDALRMVFKHTKEGRSQINRSIRKTDFLFHMFDLTTEEDIESRIEQEANRLHQSFTLEEGPLVQLALFKSQKGDYLLIIIHHLIVDGVSWRIIMEDFSHCYQQIMRKQEIDLPLKTTSYQAWSRELKEYADSKKLISQLPYWREMDQTHIAPLPVDSDVTGHGNHVKLVIDEINTKSLLTQVHSAYQTEINDILLAVLAFTIHDWTKEKRMAIMLEGHGREEIIEGVNLTRTVGWFTSMYPVICNLEGLSVSQVIKTVKETLRKVPDKGIGYGILRYLSNAERKDNYTFSLQPEIMFNYLGEFDQQGEKAEEFIMSNISTGEANSASSKEVYKLDINCAVINGEMEIIFAYSKEHYHNKTIQNLSESFKNNLLCFIHHCMNQTESEATPSDFSVNDLTLEELDDIFESLQK
ncbi:amino acid adenylation domain-containing protein [Paenibacillus sp. 102]|uniref:amino acid adenylation domain-containing protein n=1 Tax=Paenibacillus sp. 102 TaxID=3120823 RepID=UPI0031BB2702